MSSPPPLLPWGRLMRLGQEKSTSMCEYYELSRSMHCVGRVVSRCDIHIQEPYISGLHCIIRLLGKESTGTPLVEIEDQSRYGIWVNTDKVGYRRKARLKHNDKIYFTPPDSKNVTKLVYRFEVLPSGMTKVNQDLHARLSADEMPVADRTRKRTHEKAQCTQAPMKAVPTSARARHVKNMQRVDEKAEEPDSEPACAPATQSAQDSSPQVLAASAAGKKSHTPATPAEMKKAHAEELAKMKAEAAELAEANKQAAAELRVTKEAMGELREERDALKRTIDQILQDPNVSHQVWSVADLEAKIHVLERTIRARQDDLTSQTHQERPHMTPPSRRQLVEIEREVCEMKLRCYKTFLTEISKQWIEIQRKYDEVTKQKENTIVGSSGSSQSQDSIDNGHLHNARRSSLQLSAVSNEHSEPSPGDIPQTFDAFAKETISGDASHGRPAVFNIYGAGSATAGIPEERPTTHSHAQLYRTSMKNNSSVSQEIQGEESDVGDDETKGVN